MTKSVTSFFSCSESGRHAVIAVTLAMLIFAAFHDRPSPATSQRLSSCPLLPPVPCREDFASLAQSQLFLKGRAAEVGVNEGQFAARNLHLWEGQYIMIDAWAHRGAKDLETSVRGDFAEKEEAAHLARMDLARENTEFAGSRRQLIRGFSHEVAATMANSSFDWVYIDALHTYADSLRDMRAWWPKVRCCGLLSGDDYGDGLPTPMMSVERFAAKIGPSWIDIGPNGWNWGVIRAAQEFADEVHSQLLVTWLQDCPPNPMPAWYLVKHC